MKFSRKKRGRILPIFSGLLLLPVFVSAYVSPGKPTGFVNDFAGMLKPETVASLETGLSSFATNTGNEISVVTVPTLDGDTIENFAVQLFSEWGIGDEEKDTGLLLLIARDEREVRIEVGYGLEPIITDLESSRIIREVIVPAFQQGDYDAGVIGAVARITSQLEGTYVEQTVNPNNFFTDFDPTIIFYLAFFAITVLGSILGQSKSWWAGGVLGVLIGVIIGFIKGFLFIGLFSIVGLAIFGLIIDFLSSKAHEKHKSSGDHHDGPWFWGGGFGGGRGGFGGFGGGMSGGGGASGRW